MTRDDQGVQLAPNLSLLKRGSSLLSVWEQRVVWGGGGVSCKINEWHTSKRAAICSASSAKAVACRVFDII